MFKKYSYIYDLINNKKNYKLESNYLLKLVKKNEKIKSKRFLDYGCGTGKHAHYIEKNVEYVAGVDTSHDMLKIARKQFPKINFKKIDFKHKYKFDVCYSLFHVFSYLKTENEIDFFFKNISKNLNKHRLLIFDYWSKPAVLIDPPKEKKKIIKYKNKIITRSTKFNHKKNRDLIKVNFQFSIKENNQVNSFSETHDMRYFSKTKVNNYLKFYKFKLINHYTWLNRKSKNWYLCTVAQKI